MLLLFNQDSWVNPVGMIYLAEFFFLRTTFRVAFIGEFYDVLIKILYLVTVYTYAGV